jgi:hypothetical protein
MPPPRSSAWLAALIGLAGAAHASDMMTGNVTGTRFSGGDGTFGGIGLTYEHATESAGVLVGLSGTDFPVGSLTELDLDAFKILSPRLTVSGGASYGSAATLDRTDNLYKTRLTADFKVDQALTLHANYQYIDLDLIHGNLAAGSVEYRPSQSFGIKAGGGFQIGGTIDAHYGQTEIDWYGPERIYGGLVMGRTGYDPATLGETAVEERLFQIYLGTSIPIRRTILTLGFDWLSLESSARQTLRIGLTEPIPP